MLTVFRRIRHNDKGSTAIEYALIGALLVLAVAATLPNLGLTAHDTYQRVADAFSN